MRAKISKVFGTVYGAGCVIVLTLSVICTFGYIVSFFVGPETATAINLFIRRQSLPYVTLIGVTVFAIGMAKLYIDGVQVFTIREKE